MVKIKIEESFVRVSVGGKYLDRTEKIAVI